MKTALCFLVLAVAAVYGAEEKKNEKRGLLGLGYGVAHAPVISSGYYGHGLGLYSHGLSAAPLVSHSIAAAPVVSHSVAAAPVLGHGYYGGGYYGGGYYGSGYGGYGHSAPLLSHGVSYSAPLAYDSHYFGLGHGWH